MKLSKASGITLAATAAALLIGGATMSPTSVQAEDKVACFGVNACKGQGACKTAGNECKGQNACKGQGMIELTKAECEAKGGSTKDPKA